MSADLNSGSGRCLATERLIIRPLQAVIELGASMDVMAKVLNAVHHANRHGSSGDFIAIALPTMCMGFNCMLPGHEVELIGSKSSLSVLLGSDVIKSLVRRGMLNELEVCKSYFESGQRGAAYVRDRACEKHTPGWIRRTAARAERRGKPLGAAITVRGNDFKTLSLSYGQKILHVRELAGETCNLPLLVSTYGFSSANSPAILPVLPDSMRLTTHAK